MLFFSFFYDFRQLKSLSKDADILCLIIQNNNSLLAGLSGIDLGNYLIKVAVQALKKEFPTLTDFGTLSPIPGFATWLHQKLKSDPGNFKHVQPV